MTVVFCKGDATDPKGTGPIIIPHLCNDVRYPKKGFSQKLSKRWYGMPEEEYTNIQRDKGLYPGLVQIVTVTADRHVATMIVQKGFGQLCLKRVRQCFRRVVKEAQRREASIHMPHLGNGLTGHNWRDVLQIVREEMGSTSVVVYTMDLNRARYKQAS